MSHISSCVFVCVPVHGTCIELKIGATKASTDHFHWHVQRENSLHCDMILIPGNKQPTEHNRIGYERRQKRQKHCDFERTKTTFNLPAKQILSADSIFYFQFHQNMSQRMNVIFITEIISCHLVCALELTTNLPLIIGLK